MTIVDFLLARIAEDEAAAASTHSGRWTVVTLDDGWQSPSTYVVEAPPPAPGVPRYDQGEPDDPLWVMDTQEEAIARHVARHSHARVLAECQAKRAIIEQVSDIEWTGSYAVRDVVLGHLAAVYADHPDYQPEWRP